MSEIGQYGQEGTCKLIKVMVVTCIDLYYNYVRIISS